MYVLAITVDEHMPYLLEQIYASIYIDV